MGEILTLAQAAERCAALRAAGRRVVLSHGVFDLVHPGIVRHIEEARRQGDVLVVTVAGDKALAAGPVRPIFPEALRAENAAALAQVDFVAVTEEATPFDCIRLLKPDVFARAQPASGAERQLHSFLFDGQEGVDLGTTSIYETIGLLTSSAALLHSFLDVYPEETRVFLQEFTRRHTFADLHRWLDDLRDTRVVLVGDTIIDEYHYCLPLGKSGKSPLVVQQYCSHEVFAGGALAIANHLAGLCKEVSLVTLLGEEDAREDFIRAHLRPNVRPTFFRRPDGPTIIKKRYLDQYLNQKLFEVNYLNTHAIPEELERTIEGHLADLLPGFDLTLVSDYGHGFLTPGLIRAVERSARHLAVNTQSNGGNVGYNMITKYLRSNFICLDEMEIRWAAQDKESPIEDVARRMSARLGCDLLISTLGKRGSIGITRAGEVNRTPIFSAKVVDTVGAGDAFFAFTAPCVVHNIPLDLVCFIGNLAGALAVKIVGNRRPVERAELLEFAAALLR
ncbi:MAG TPA: PfkB family carbohydrate kinase [Candidatus Methanoperedens sp.]|nr:PfkB family carbohydrate kinase [Candidatus Methanoperedens sp.]